MIALFIYCNLLTVTCVTYSCWTYFVQNAKVHKLAIDKWWTANKYRGMWDTVKNYRWFHILKGPCITPVLVFWKSCYYRRSSSRMVFFTQPVRTLFLFKSIWTRYQGSQGCQKIHRNMLQIKVLNFCARIAPKRHKLRKIIKIEKKCQKKNVFLEYFEYSSIWRPS